MLVRLAAGATVDKAIMELRDLEANSRNLPNPGHPVDFRESYVRWAKDTEMRLRTVLARADAQSFFENPRHRDICSMTIGNQLSTLIYAELEAKTLDFGDLARSLEEARKRMSEGPGYPTVIDTNVLLHCQRPDYINWTGVVDDEVRIIIPLRVLEEVNDKKHSTNRKLADRARSVLPWLEKQFDTTNGPVRIRAMTTIEVLLADTPRYYPADADEEILAVCRDVRDLAGRVKLVTGDPPMRMRARAEQLDVISVPDSWRPKVLAPNESEA
jgi:rRNA-processing protein FCF1